jgi:hypothetical protein
MIQKGLFEKYKHLLYSVLTLAVGISILAGNESKFYGWCILSISFGFLVTWLGQLVDTKQLKTVLHVLSFAVPGVFIIYGLVTNQIHLPIY